MSKKPSKKSVTLSFEKDLQSDKLVGSIVEGEDTAITKDINAGVAAAMRHAFGRMGEWITDFETLIDSGDHRAAYILLEKNFGTISFSDRKILDALLSLDVKALEEAEKKKLGIYLVAAANRENRTGDIEARLELYIGEFENVLENGLKQAILLASANASAVNSKFNVARTRYYHVLNDSHTSIVNQAYALRGLSMISSDAQEMVEYRKRGIDKFLEAGERQEAVGDLAYLARYFGKDDPSQAVDLIDRAIQLYDLNTKLSKEYAASLYHTKAAYLHSIRQNDDALQAAEKACALRENLIGNEHEAFSTYALAEAICRIVKNSEKEKYYADKLAQLTPLIKTQEFLLQEKLTTAIARGELVSDELLAEIEKSGTTNHKFGAYLIKGTHQSKTFEEKLVWLDKAVVLLNEREFTNQHYSILYYSIAEEWRKQGSVDIARKNYETSLHYNPFQYLSIQNCGAMLWGAKRWDDSVEFFKKQIDRFGDSPVLSYAYGRSLLEVSRFNEAFPYLKKAKGKVQGLDVDPYLLKCLEEVNDLQPETVKETKPVETRVSLEAFKNCIEEFARSVSSNSRMHFWQSIPGGGHKWKPFPEETGKQLLITALNMKFGNDAIEIIQERPAGAGIIDLYIILRGGTKVVLELKMCGANYSSTYAISGEDQLVHYIKNSQTRLGYLIVFDGRIKDFGKGLKPVQGIGNATIFTTAIQIAPKIS